MAKIKIKDLPKGMKIKQDELRQIRGGGVTVNVNNISVVHQSSDGMTVAFPDVCLTPPGSEGPIPIPYPNVGSSSDSSKGTKKVKV